jgi:hypothetical protein
VVQDNSNLVIDLSIDESAYKLSWAGDYMGDLRSLNFDFKPVKLTSPNLNFIAAESVLAPGMTMVDIKGVHTPFDVMLVGDLRDEA